MPTRRLALITAVLAPLWMFSGWTSGMLVAASTGIALLIAVLVDAAMTPGQSELTIERRVPPVIGLGDEQTASLTIVSRWPRAVGVLPLDRLPSLVSRTTELPWTAVDAMNERDVPFTITGRKRGVATLGPLAARVRGPLGLVERALHWREPGDRVTIAPSIAPVRRYRLLALQHRLRDAGVRSLRRRGEGTGFSGLREYAVGDDPRRVDWKATARRGVPITREYTVEQGQTVIIAVDAGRLMTQFAGQLPRFEYALEAAVVLADVAVSSGDHVGLMVFNDEVRAYVPPARGRSALQAIREALVAVQPSMVEPDYAAAFRMLASRHRKRALLVLFTDVIDTRSSQAVIAHATRGTARHLPLVVALRNDELVAAAQPAPRAGAATLYESAAAEELLQARSEALGRMRQAGATVLDVSPFAMTAALVNRYLEIKRRGVL